MIDMTRLRNIDSGETVGFVAKGEHHHGDFGLVVLGEFDVLIDADGITTGWYRWVPHTDDLGTTHSLLYPAQPRSRGAFIATFYDAEEHGTTEIPASWRPNYDAEEAAP